MNAIIKAIDDVKYKIPRQILEEVFTKRTYRWRDAPISMDEQIINQVINPRVLVDCNLVGGTEVLIDLSGLQGEIVDNYSTVYVIPKDRTQGRSINSVLNIGYGSIASASAFNNGGQFNPCSVTPITQGAQSLMTSMSPVPMVSSAKIQIIGENVIMVRDVSPPMSYSFLRCILSNDETLSHIQLRSYPKFSKLVEFAVKSFIYNKLIIDIDQAFLSGGQSLGRFKDVVDSYSDYEQMYQDYLQNTWTKVSFMNDRESNDRLLKTMIGGAR